MSYKVTVTTSSSNALAGDTPPHRNLPELHVTPNTLGWYHAFSPGHWKGQHVWVHACTPRLDDRMWLAGQLCAPYEHELYPMMHHNPDGPDWATGFLSCDKCFGTAFEPRTAE